MSILFLLAVATFRRAYVHDYYTYTKLTCVLHRLGVVSRANADHVQGTLLPFGPQYNI